MGATCSKDTPASESRGSVVASRTWRNVYTEEFTRIFSPTEAEENWAKGIFELMKEWDQSAEMSFTNMQRWGDFLILDLGSPYLKYASAPTSAPTPFNNMFTLLHTDFSDHRNPIGALISSFTSTYFAQYIDEIQEAIDTHDLQKAPFFLSTLAATILKFQSLLAKTTLALYTNIAILLEKKMDDLEGVILTSLVQGEMYRLLERLASVLYIRETEEMKSAVHMTHSLTPESLGLSKAKVTAVVEMRCREAKDVLLRMASSENLYEKRLLLVQVDQLVREMSPDEATKRSLIAWIVFKSGLYTILPQLHLAKLFFSVAPGVLQLCNSAVGMLIAAGEKEGQEVHRPSPQVLFP